MSAQEDMYSSNDTNINEDRGDIHDDDLNIQRC